MFGGKETKVTIEADNDKVGILIDRFGKDIMLFPIDKDHFKTTITVAVSKQFLSWIISLGPEIKTVSPDEVVNLMKDEIQRLYNDYFE